MPSFEQFRKGGGGVMCSSFESFRNERKLRLSAHLSRVDFFLVLKNQNLKHSASKVNMTVTANQKTNSTEMRKWTPIIPLVLDI